MRSRLFLPALLASALPATAADYSACFAAVDSMKCIIDTAEFERLRNAEIHTSMVRVSQSRALVKRNQAKIDAAAAFHASLAKKRFEDNQNRLASASMQRVYAERERAQIAHLNALANRSVARVEAERQRQLAYKNRSCQGATDVRPRCAAQYVREFARHQNDLARASMQRVAAERLRAFEVARNNEIRASMARVAQVRAAEYAAATTHCDGAVMTPRCQAEQSRELARALTHCKSATDTSPRCAAEFARARNAEIERSLAAVARERSSDIVTASTNVLGRVSAAEYAAFTSHCARAPQSPRCEAERAREFARARNAEIERSLAAVARQRGNYAAFKLSADQYAAVTSYCAHAPQGPRCEVERQREFARARNVEIERSLAAVARERASKITTASTAKTVGYSISHCDKGLTPRCEAEKRREAALAACKQAGYTAPGCNFATGSTAKTVGYSTSHCDKGSTPRCEAEKRREAALATCKQAGYTSSGCNFTKTAAAPANASATTAATYSLSHCDKGSTPRCVAERAREFARARNAEIEASLAAVAKARAPSPAARAFNHYDAAPLETGALGSRAPSLDSFAKPKLTDRHAAFAPPCRSIGVPFSPLAFGKGLELNDTITVELDRVASIAEACPGVRVEVHGYSDNRGTPFAIRNMSQARAQAAVDYLIAAGMSPNRVVGIGRSATEPRFPNTTEANRARNRRIEIVIRDPGMQEAARKVMWDLAELLDPTYIPAVAGLSP
jgi:outer membrane protein OmpA-like peptidoglycan-associated protein/muconolactone delta-isomerase